MSRKELFLTGLVVLLAGLYVVYFTGWFRPKFMRIEHSERSVRAAWSGGGQRVNFTNKQLGNVTFALHRDYKLTSVKVVPLAEFLTNKYAHPLWELVCKPGSPPIDGFAYGAVVPGMTQPMPDIEPEPLEPGVTYRLLVMAGSIKGEHDFKVERVARR